MWVWVWVLATVFFFILRAGGAIQSVPLCLYLSAVAGALAFCLDQLRTTGSAHPLLRLRQIVLVVLLVAIPPLFDPATGEIDNLPRFVVLVVAAVLILAIWGVDAAWSGWRPRRLANGFQWILLAIVIWFGVTTLTSVEPRQSLLGRYGSYEGFLLIAALAVIAMAVAESFPRESLPALFRMMVAASVPVLVYGGIQLYGFDVSKKSPPDFVAWHNAYHNVFASFGNPNHFGGYLVTILPLGVVTAVLTKKRWTRVTMWAWVALALLLLLQTAARGAWLAAVVGGGVLVVGLLPRIRARARTVGLVAAGGLIVAVGLVAGGSRFLGAKASALFQFGSKSSVAQRYGYWRAALHLTSHHPLVGTGPDTFAATYTRYQDATLAKTLGSNFFVNGAHNIFFSWMANEGIVGFLLLLGLFVFGVAWGVRTWLSLRNDTTEPETEGPDRTVKDAPRYLVAGLVASFVAYFVQASFDVEQVATLFVPFVVLGLLGTMNRGTWTLPTLMGQPLRPRGTRADLDTPLAEEDHGYPIRSASAGVYGRSTAQARGDVRRLAVAAVAAVVGITAVSITYWRMDALWRADHDAWFGTQATIVRATQLNPWEPSYFQTLSQAAFRSFSNNPKASDALAIAQAGVSYARQNVALDGANSIAQGLYGSALVTEAGAQPSDKVALLHRALVALHRAQEDNPFDTEVRQLIAFAEKALRH